MFAILTLNFWDFPGATVNSDGTKRTFFAIFCGSSDFSIKITSAFSLILKEPVYALNLIGFCASPFISIAVVA